MKKLKLRRGLALNRPQVPKAIKEINKSLRKPGEIGRAVPIPVRGTDEETAVTSHTEIWAYTTDPTGVSELVYSAEKPVRVLATLLSAGPVDIGTRQDLSPVNSGKGAPMVTDVPIEFTLDRGDRLYLAANTRDRVSFFVAQIPWFETILLTVGKFFRK